MRQEKTESGIMDLPTDLMFGIFFRLECKDIVSCRDVCRTWYDLLSDPNFSSNYTRYSPLTTVLVSEVNDHSNYIFLIQVTANGEFIRWRIKPKVPQTSERTSTRTLKQYIEEYPEEVSLVKVIGSCNGLVFLLQTSADSPHDINQSEQIYICNPLLGGCLKLTESKRANKLVYFVKYEVGFVPSTNKIKLLSIGFTFSGVHDRVVEAHILTFREDDEWRKLKDPLVYLYHPTSGTCFNGTYHWVDRFENVNWIRTFDFGEEKFGRIAKAPALLKFSYLNRMAVLNNHLCLIDFTYGDLEMNIWIMKEYGVTESWSKYIVLRSCWFLGKSFLHLFPLAILPNRDILFAVHGSGYLKFSHKDKRFTKVQFHDGFRPTHLLYASTYAPRFYALEEDASGRKH